MRGFVFNIQRFSINDGPGIRTTVFVKGCNLRCLWCHNPESFSLGQEIQYFHQRCVMCGKCIEVCSQEAHYITDEGVMAFDRSKCMNCGRCVENCMYDALVNVGGFMKPDEVIEVVKRDTDYYRNSGGGLTISGGEPLLQKEFVKEVFQKSRSFGIHNALDTAAAVNWTDLEYVLPYVDLVLLDLKAMDTEVHKSATGISNELVLRNALKLAEKEVSILVRIPVIPGINDTEDNMYKTAEFLKDFKNLIAVEMLPYHDMGTGKYQTIGMTEDKVVFHSPTEARLKELSSCFQKYNIKVKVLGGRD